MTPSTALRSRGLARLPAWPVAHAHEMLAHLSGREQFDGHVKGRGRRARPDSAQTSWSMKDVVTAPHLLEYALALTDVAAEYLGTAPVMYSVNAFTMHPSSQPLSRDTQEFHRDKDDGRFVVLFVYLTDVTTPSDGAHQFKAGTHGGAEDGETLTLLGPAGTAFLADTRGLHRGLRPAATPRTIAWVRWCVSDPPQSYGWDRLSPVGKELLGARYPSDPGLQRSIRLVVT